MQTSSSASASPAAALPGCGPRLSWKPPALIRLSLLLHALAVPAVLLQPRHWSAIVLALVGNHALLGLLGMWPRSRLIDHNIVRLPPAAAARGEVSLSFDDGPDPQVTPQVLRILDQHGAKASFFFPAMRAAAQPALVREVLRQGHSVENHSLRHAFVFATYGWWRLRRELLASQGLLAAAGATPRFFRAPVGLRNPLLDPLLARAGLRYVSWTRRGYDAVSGDARQVLRRLLRGLAAGDILLLHDGGSARAPSGEPVVLQILPPLLDQLRQQGLRSVSLPMAFGAEC